MKSKKTTYLLDVNLLISLFDTAHIHHAIAHQWFESKGIRSWSTCPLTENGLLRILSSPAYPNSPTPIKDLSKRLEEFKTSTQSHSFWNDEYSFSEWLADRKITIGSSQLTDAYLLQLCHRKEARLATFDRRIQPKLIGEKIQSILEYIS